MRRIYAYQVIRYFPHVLSDEFVNIGVVLISDKKSSRILTEDEAKQLHCSALIGDKQKFLGVIEYLNKLASDGRLVESTHYFHNFRFSEERKIASEKNEDAVVDEIFEDYVGFKIHSEEKTDIKAIIFEKSIKLAHSSSFRNYVRINKDKTGRFDFEVESIKKQIVHYSIVGKTTLKQDVTRMVMETPDHREAKQRYDFLNINGEFDSSNPYVKKLEHNFVDPYPYKTEEQIANYFELVAS